MLEIFVSKQEADYHTLQEAVDAVPYETEAVIHVAAGIYEEKVFCEKKNITIEGDNADNTVLSFGDGAFDIHPDGTKRGTFRTATLFISGEKTTLRNLTIRNTAGDGRVAGQALALYADSSLVFAENVVLDAHQDTLFCAPLPVSERQKNGFLGPRMLTERKKTSQYYKNCQIIGDVDFIFGGANAVFENCDIVCRDREHAVLEIDEPEGDKDQIGKTTDYVNGYITAPCGLRDAIGFVFVDCFIHGENGCGKNTVFLGRPWREEAKATFINCRYDDTISPYRFSGWGGVTRDEPDTFFAEYGGRLVDSIGEKDVAQVDMSGKNPWVKVLTSNQADDILKDAAEIKNAVTK